MRSSVITPSRRRCRSAVPRIAMLLKSGSLLMVPQFGYFSAEAQQTVGSREAMSLATRGTFAQSHHVLSASTDSKELLRTLQTAFGGNS